MIKNLVKTALILLLTVLSSTAVFAEVLDNNFLKSEIEQQVFTKLSKTVKGDMEVDVKTIPFRKLEIPTGEKRIYITMHSDEFSVRKLVMVQIQVNGKKIKKFSVPVYLKLYDEVLVTTENILKGKSLSCANVSVERKDITKIYKKVLRQEKNLTDYIASRNVRAGQILDKRYILSKPDVMKDSVVSVIFETGGLNIAIDGEAMQNASVGDYVKVKSDRYDKCYTGKVISPNKVLVRI